MILEKNLEHNKEIMVEVRQVKKSYKKVEAVKGIDLTIKKGEFIALLGPNGAGKTTLVEMIEGLQPPDSGEILIKGKKWKGNERELHQIIGISFQETRFIEKLTVFEILTLFGSFYKLPSKRINEVIELVGLEEKRKAYTVHLSGGQRQRLALGISLLNNPQILLLDEPTTGLDPTARRELWNILMELKSKSNTSMILTTHYMEEAEVLCNYIIIMDHGKILAEGTLAQLIHEEGYGKTIDFTLENFGTSIDLPEELEGVKIHWSKKEGKGKLFINRLQNDIPIFFAYLSQQNISLKTFECKRRTLDDLFISMTGRRLDEE